MLVHAFCTLLFWDAMQNQTCIFWYQKIQVWFWSTQCNGCPLHCVVPQYIGVYILGGISSSAGESTTEVLHDSLYNKRACIVFDMTIYWLVDNSKADRALEAKWKLSVHLIGQWLELLDWCDSLLHICMSYNLGLAPLFNWSVKCRQTCLWILLISCQYIHVAACVSHLPHSY